MKGTKFKEEYKKNIIYNLYCRYWSGLRIDPDFNVKVKLRVNNGIVGESYGTYTKEQFSPHTEKGWYPILFNLTSKSIKRDVEEHGVDNYLAACERTLNNDTNKKKYGTIVLLELSVDHSLHEDRDHRFLSCIAKTNRKSIKGFVAQRKEGYRVLE